MAALGQIVGVNQIKRP